MGFIDFFNRIRGGSRSNAQTPGAASSNEHTKGLESGDQTEVASAMQNAARQYGERGEHAQAEALFKRALAIRENTLGLEHPEVAAALNDLALTYMKQGQCEMAEPLFKRAMAIIEKSLGPDHLEMARTLNNFALTYMKQRQYTQAEPLYIRSLPIWEKTVGLDHPKVAATLNNLAGLYGEQGQYAQAKPLFQRALAIMEKSLGPDHPQIAMSLQNMAAICREMGEQEDADALERRAAAIRTTSPAPGTQPMYPELQDENDIQRVFPGDVYAVLSVFTPAMIDHDGDAILGMRVLLCLDVGGKKVIHQDSVRHQPSHLTAQEVISLLEPAFASHPKPKICLICGSCYMSSSVLPAYLANVDGKFMETHSSFVKTLGDAGITFGGMPKEEEEHLNAWLAKAQVEARFTEVRDMEHQVGERLYQDFRRRYTKT